MLEITLQAFVLGLGAGLAPGPLLALVMSESLRGGPRAGMRVAVAPLLTDTPVVALSWLLVGSLDPASPWLAVLSLGGALVVGQIALEQWNAALPEAGAAPPPGSRSLLRGAAVNLLSPHPWLFWITLGGPLLAQAADRSPWRAVAFLAVFYLLLVGTKLVLAVLAGRWGRSLTGIGYGRVCRVLAVVLLAFAVQLGWYGLTRLAGA
jgi:threonine/homoserine/homoserine lactone efflux protein